MSLLKWSLAFGLAAGCAACASDSSSRPPRALADRATWVARAPDSPDLAAFGAKLTAHQQENAADISGFDPADGFDLGEAEIAGLFYNGGLRVERARLEGITAGAAKAGLWPDPKLNLGALRILEDAVEPWVIGVDAALTVPVLGSASQAKRLAEARAEAESWRVAAQEWNFIRELRKTWIEWSAFDAQATLTAEQIETVSKILEIVSALSQADEIPRTEMRLFAIERSTLESEHHHFSHEAEERVMSIKAMMGFRTDAEIPLLTSIRPFEIPQVNEHPHEKDEESISMHPEIMRVSAEYETAKATLARERRAMFGEIGLGPAYESDEGVGKAGGNAGATLPLWNRNQQAIAEAEATVRAAELARETEIERMTTALATAEHRLEAAQGDWRLLNEDLAPLVQQQVDEARAVAELGELNTLLLLETFKTSYETRLRMIEVQAEIALAGVEVMHIAAHEPMPARMKEFMSDEE